MGSMMSGRNLNWRLLLLSPGATARGATRSLRMVALTPKNWKQLEKSPHVWFVNICRIG